MLLLWLMLLTGGLCKIGIAKRGVGLIHILRSVLGWQRRILGNVRMRH